MLPLESIILIYVFIIPGHFHELDIYLFVANILSHLLLHNLVTQRENLGTSTTSATASI